MRQTVLTICATFHLLCGDSFASESCLIKDRQPPSRVLGVPGTCVGQPATAIFCARIRL